MRTLSMARTPALVAAACAAGVGMAGCASPPRLPDAGDTRPPELVAGIDGFSGPEAVRYDAEQDVYFVGNFNGAGGAIDDNGFISRVRPDGRVEQLRFIAGGTNGVTLHAPRGMTITGDTLWVADVDAVRAFQRRSGAPLASVSFRGVDVGFLNDVAPGPDGSIYVTDTGRNRIYRVAGVTASVAAADSALDSPNGITWDPARSRMIVAPFGGSRSLLAWSPGSTEMRMAGSSATGARFDGVEVRQNGSILVASQADSSIHLFRGGEGRALFKVAGRPADIAYDTRRNRVIVPYVARNRIEIWQLAP